MPTPRILLVILGGAILFAAGWIAFRAVEASISLRSVQEILLRDPVLIGDLDDPFVYAGGDGVRPIEGEGRIRFSEGTGRASVRASVRLEGSAAVLRSGAPVVGELVLRSPADASPVERDVVIHGESERGEPALPETTALLFSSGPLNAALDGAPVQRETTSAWSVAHALRRDDGAIRNRGLVFSPLLRDDTVFEDPDRLEATFLVYHRPEEGDPRIVLHVVFRDVEIVDPAARTTRSE